jgi:hypothetical protein
MHIHLYAPCPLQVEHDGFGNGGREGVAVIMPRGVYKITKMVEIYQSNVVLRGEGVSGWAQGGTGPDAPHSRNDCQPGPCSGPLVTFFCSCCSCLSTALVPATILQADKTVLYFPKGLQQVYGEWLLLYRLAAGRVLDGAGAAAGIGSVGCM